MKKNVTILDNVDQRILEELQKDCRNSIGHIAKTMSIPKSTIQYRIKRLESIGIISGYHAKINFEKVGKDYVTITFVRAKYGKKSYEKVRSILGRIPGVFGVYFVLGDVDFVVLCRSNNREEFKNKLDVLFGIEEIERTSTMVVMETIETGSKIDFNCGDIAEQQ